MNTLEAFRGSGGGTLSKGSPVDLPIY